MNAPRAVVVGTGAGGLAASAYLAEEGFEVRAFEQAERVGGYIASFEIDGYTFNPGLHYVGECAPGQMLWEFFDGLGYDTRELFRPLDPDGFDVYQFPDLQVAMCAGLDRYQDRLVNLFPREHSAIDRFVSMVRHLQSLGHLGRAVQTRRPSFGEIRTALSAIGLGRWVRSTYGELLEALTDNHRLRAVLAAACGDYGLPPGRASALTGLALVAHYAEGAYVPRGGSGALCDLFVDYTQERGGEFRTGAEVSRILVRDGAVTGVELVDGERIEADVVVSAVDPTITYGRFVDSKELPVRLRQKVVDIEPSLGSIHLFLGVRRDVSQCGLGAFNRWDYPWWDLDALYAPAVDGELAETHAFFLSSLSAKHPDEAFAPEGCSSLEIVTLAPYEPFARAAGGASGKRGEQYAELKAELQGKLLDEVRRRNPELVGDIDVIEMGTPLTNETYVGAVAGGIYGPAQTVEQTFGGRFQTRAPIDGLYLAGAGVFGGGVAPSLLSGQAAAWRASADFHKQTNRRRFGIQRLLGGPFPPSTG